MEFIPRAITSRIEKAHAHYPTITITGPRQSGKSTLCRHLFPDYKYTNLESILTRSVASNDPHTFLENLGDKAIIDEVQHVPQLLSEIQVLTDENPRLRYILTGSSNFSLLKSVSQSLAGRTSLFTLLPFSFSEIPHYVKDTGIENIMYNGFYPGVIVKGIDPQEFYESYYNTYVERDLRDLLKVSNLLKFDTFVRLMAMRVGTEFNASALSREVGVSAVTISEWMSLLVTYYIVFELPPYFNNPGKSLTKQKKIYFYDTGLLCYLLSITNADALGKHPMRGGIFENLAVSAFIKRKLTEGSSMNTYFYRENRGPEIDIVTPMTDGGLHLYEIKAGKTLQPDYAANMKKVASGLQIPTKSTVIYNGESMPPAVINVRDL